MKPAMRSIDPSDWEPPELLPNVFRSLGERGKPPGFSRPLVELTTGVYLPNPESPFAKILELMLDPARRPTDKVPGR